MQDRLKTNFIAPFWNDKLQLVGLNWGFFNFMIAKFEELGTTIKSVEFDFNVEQGILYVSCHYDDDSILVEMQTKDAKDLRDYLNTRLENE